MPNNSKIGSLQKFSLVKVERLLLYLLLFILPLVVVPLSWDWNERPMSLCILLFTTIIAGLEIIKLVKEGKFCIIRTSMDVGILLLCASYILSTIFSQDVNTSLWGIDNKLGGGLITVMSVVALTIFSRSFITDVKHVKILFFSFMAGMFVNNILSILAFLGINIWSAIPVYKDMFQEGLPILRSARVYILTNLTTLLISFGFIGEYLIFKGKKSVLMASFVAALASIAGILMFSIVQGTGLVVLFLILFVLLNIFVIKKFKLSETSFKHILVLFLIITLSISIPFALMHIPSFRESKIPEDFRLVGQVFLGNDLSWSVSSSVFVKSLSTALFGLGMDTYSIAYNMFKPISENLLAYNNVTFYTGGNEIYTQFANGGLVWLLCWAIFGYSIFKSVFFDLKKLRLNSGKINTWYLVVVDFVIVLIFCSSLFTAFSVINLFVLFLMVSMRGVLKDILNEGNEEKIAVKLWAGSISGSPEKGSAKGNFRVLLAIIITAVMLLVARIWVYKGISTGYMLMAESYRVSEGSKLTDQKISYEDRKNIADTIIGHYNNAAKFDKNNPLVNRKLGLAYMDKIDLEVKEYLSVEEGKRNEGIVSEVNKLKNYAIDSTKKSTEIAGYVYSNWESMANVYMGLVGMGYEGFVPDSIFSIEKAISLNPSNYELYFKEAQMYVIGKDTDNALSSLTKVLGINPQYIPALYLSAELNKEKGRVDVYESYLRAAKTILETNDATNNEVYTDISKKLKELESTSTTQKQESDNEKTEESD
ncbi:MAG TPA: hypothetical protein PLD77_01020 [Candidatus Dojkabacteria bacterium]|nr:hypothetical protein [Candidatus Dojkabacteria bacterium]